MNDEISRRLLGGCCIVRAGFRFPSDFPRALLGIGSGTVASTRRSTKVSQRSLKRFWQRIHRPPTRLAASLTAHDENNTGDTDERAFASALESMGRDRVDLSDKSEKRDEGHL